MSSEYFLIDVRQSTCQIVNHINHSAMHYLSNNSVLSAIQIFLTLNRMLDQNMNACLSKEPLRLQIF